RWKKASPGTSAESACSNCVTPNCRTPKSASPSWRDWTERANQSYSRSTTPRPTGAPPSRGDPPDRHRGIPPGFTEPADDTFLDLQRSTLRYKVRGDDGPSPVAAG